MLNRLMQTDKDISALILRVILGIVFFAHGAQKVTGWFGGSGFSATLRHFTEVVGLPAVLALLVIAAEFLGSIGLIVGLFTRVAAFGIACVMLGAISLVHLQHGFFMNWGGSQQGEGFEYHLLAIAITMALMIRGGGSWSLDHLLMSRGKGG